MKRRFLCGRSLKLDLSFLSLAFSVPVVLFFLITNMYSVKNARTHEADLLKHSLNVYQSQVDGDFGNFEKYLVGILDNREDLNQLASCVSSNDRVLAQMRLQNQFLHIMSINQRLYGMFAYCTENGRLAYNYASDVKLKEREALKEAAATLFEYGYQSGDWFPVFCRDRYYFFRVIHMQGIYVGAVVSVDELLEEYYGSGKNTVNYLNYSTGEGNLLEVSQVYENALDIMELQSEFSLVRKEGISYLATAVPSSYGDFYLTGLVEEKGVFDGLSGFQLVIAGIAGICFLIMKLQRRYFQWAIIDPLEVTVEAMQEVRQGKLDTCIQPRKVYREFQVVHESFNAMVSQIHQLKIDVYEEKLAQKQTKLQYLQLQMNPHFFANAINVIQRMCEQKQYQRIPQVASWLAGYMRYTLSYAKVVALESELKHVDEYIELQNMRFDSTLVLTKEIDIHGLFVAVPKLLVYTFVENAFKYARRAGSLTYVAVRASLEGQAERKRLVVEISDSGPGYPEHVRRMLQAGEMVVDQRGEHIGIHNIFSRLELLYGREAGCEIGNKNGHAWVRMSFPAVEIDEWERNGRV